MSIDTFEIILRCALSIGEEIRYNIANKQSKTEWCLYPAFCNLYQIFTYVKNKDAEFGDEPHRVSGMLLYAATDKAIQPDNSYRMSGN